MKPQHPPVDDVDAGDALDDTRDGAPFEEDAVEDGAEPSGSVALRKPPPGLHVVATPIGNAGDITLRALETLKGVDAIACEDTRVTSKLMARYQVRKPLLAYHEHNAARMRPQLLARMAAGEAIALVSDAGTPLISDPGYKLVREAREQGLHVTHLPGASATLTALVLAGLPSDRFLFAGFLPSRTGPRRAALEELAPVRATLVLFESAQRLADLLADAAQVLGGREVAVARELTKLFEEVRRGTLADLAAHYAEAGPPRGEVVVVVGPPMEGNEEAVDIDGLLRAAMRTLSVRDAAATVAEASGAPRKQIYQRALELSKEGVGAKEGVGEDDAG
ncbi:16S rRNA (cytidine(1402)-2'-O)-methyltransferase [Nitrospirillum iridis]|uniref:Ribosomal RNA small subunit methyltransferase I n=1 Tax=Nitrospirillum iridis TaxID=765888 RepID=A0A7X0B1I7_9PROT|nr:16S rRNA (cytidine(1402)-2'-O)-methyltransferase [Nitrospirillum iridis]MBB6252666.1 16S rRNA (cytidine1402-2'-O)-methyltransferase [Nitrospirillum iridis]